MMDPYLLLGLAAASLGGAAALIAVAKKQDATASGELDLGGEITDVHPPADPAAGSGREEDTGTDTTPATGGPSPAALPSAAAAPAGDTGSDPGQPSGDTGSDTDADSARGSDGGRPAGGQTHDRHSTLLNRLPGAARRERRRFAAVHGFDYVKHDDYLAGEFDFPDVPVDMRARDAVSGISHGKEIHLADFGGHTVLAVRRSAASPVVVRFVRTDSHPDAEQPVTVASAGGFTAWAAEPGPAATFVDVRVRSALAALAPAITEIVVAGQWVAALVGRQDAETTAAAAIAPLGLIADAALVLPPFTPAGVAEPADCDPTRPALLTPQSAARSTGALPAPPGLAAAARDTTDIPDAEIIDEASDEAPDGAGPRTIRRGGGPVTGTDEGCDHTEPDGDDAGVGHRTSPHRLAGPEGLEVDLPTRSVGQRHGSMDLHVIGGDLIEPIADGTTRPPAATRPRVARRGGRPSIFTDASGTAPAEASDGTDATGDGDTTQPPPDAAHR
ncbi:hypothetical protein JZY06_11270 [Corynebacterium sp. CCM 8862]|uniref:Secreted protein n=1 Tax=Corynebacterium mendelii TaxID=2765362 RepID=A0A939IY57_9CORY|nr:hypothetical protein [Corynebacterium mendelii]MBN9645185.1 hypothetical protein [Corynebacterium mendelii]